jgi:hypothetical protein
MHIHSLLYLNVVVPRTARKFNFYIIYYRLYMAIHLATTSTDLKK